MSPIRITLALFASIVMSALGVAQVYNSSGDLVFENPEPGSVGYIQSVIDSLGLDAATDKPRQKDLVVTNLAEHPVHAMRRRKAMRDSANPSSSKTAFATAKEIGLHGKWFVTFGKKDGYFSEAQIGQQPGDVITMLPKEDARGLIPVG